MNLKILHNILPNFKRKYENYMLEKCGNDILPIASNIITPKKHGIFHNYRPWEHDKVCAYGDFKKDDLVLDTGALHTYFSIFLAQFVRQIIVTDNFYWAKRDYQKIEKLFTPERWMKYIQDKGEGKIIAQEADLMSLPFPDNMFDKILCISTIEHVLDDTKAIHELARVLKKDGLLLLSTEFNFLFGKGYSEEDNSYYRIYTFNALKKLLSQSGLRLHSPLIVESRRIRYILNRKFVNAFVCLKK